MDPLSDAVALLRPSAVLSKPITGRGKWSVRYAAYRQPGFAIVIEGHCWLALEGDRPLGLRAGDFVLLPATPSFTLYSEPGTPCLDAEPSGRPVHHGDEGPPDFRMFGGAFTIEPANAPLITDLLPRRIHVAAGDEGAGRLSRIVEQVRDECEADRPGRDVILQRLLEVMLVECLRHDPVAGDADRAGLLAGMRDPALSRALRAVHENVRHGWTVAELARVAGVSRSVFAARFQQVLGCPPIEYLVRWRMALARNALVQGGKPLDRLAEEIGYESASAFSTAFRRRYGCAPGRFARGFAEQAAYEPARESLSGRASRLLSSSL
jgi:AraC-like DNA-binding protein